MGFFSSMCSAATSSAAWLRGGACACFSPEGPPAAAVPARPIDNRSFVQKWCCVKPAPSADSISGLSAIDLDQLAETLMVEVPVFPASLPVIPAAVLVINGAACPTSLKPGCSIDSHKNLPVSHFAPTDLPGFDPLQPDAATSLNPIRPSFINNTIVNNTNNAGNDIVQGNEADDSNNDNNNNIIDNNNQNDIEDEEEDGENEGTGNTGGDTNIVDDNTANVIDNAVIDVNTRPSALVSASPPPSPTTTPRLPASNPQLPLTPPPPSSPLQTSPPTLVITTPSLPAPAPILHTNPLPGLSPRAKPLVMVNISPILTSSAILAAPAVTNLATDVTATSLTTNFTGGLIARPSSPVLLIKDPPSPTNGAKAPAECLTDGGIAVPAAETRKSRPSVAEFFKNLATLVQAPSAAAPTSTCALTAQRSPIPSSPTSPTSRTAKTRPTPKRTPNLTIPDLAPPVTTLNSWTNLPPLSAKASHPNFKRDSPEPSWRPSSRKGSARPSRNNSSERLHDTSDANRLSSDTGADGQVQFTVTPHVPSDTEVSNADSTLRAESSAGSNSRSDSSSRGSTKAGGLPFSVAGFKTSGPPPMTDREAKAAKAHKSRISGSSSKPAARGVNPNPTPNPNVTHISSSSSSSRKSASPPPVPVTAPATGVHTTRTAKHKPSSRRASKSSSVSGNSQASQDVTQPAPTPPISGTRSPQGVLRSSAGIVLPTSPAVPAVDPALHQASAPGNFLSMLFKKSTKAASALAPLRDDSTGLSDPSPSLPHPTPSLTPSAFGMMFKGATSAGALLPSSLAATLASELRVEKHPDQLASEQLASEQLAAEQLAADQLAAEETLAIKQAAPVIAEARQQFALMLSQLKTADGLLPLLTLEEQIEITRDTALSELAGALVYVRTLGRGACGDVNEIKWAAGKNGTAAVKTILLTEEQVAGGCVGEGVMMTELHTLALGQGFLQLYRMAVTRGPDPGTVIVHLVMELGLNTLLHTVEEARMKAKERIYWMASQSGSTSAEKLSFRTAVQFDCAEPLIGWLVDIVRALKVCSDRHVIHGDMKSDNVIIKQDGSAAISDCGECTYLPDDLDSVYRIGGTRNYQAPELMDITTDGEPSVCSRATDIFALTVMICEMLSPWVTSIFAALMPDLSDLLQFGLSTDPSARPMVQNFVNVLEAGQLALQAYKKNVPALTALLVTPDARARRLPLDDVVKFVMDVRFELTYKPRDHEDGFLSLTQEDMRAAWLAGDAVFLEAQQLSCFLNSTALMFWDGDVEQHLVWLQEGLFETERVMLRVKVILQVEEGFRTLRQSAVDDPDRFSQLYAQEEAAVDANH